MDTITNKPIFYPFQEITFKEAGGFWYIIGILLLILSVIVFMVSSLHFSYLSDKVQVENNSKNPPKQIINQARAQGFATSNFIGFMVCILFLFYVIYKACFLTHNTNLARKQTYDNEIKEFEKNFEKYETQRKTLEKQRRDAEERNKIYENVEKIRQKGIQDFSITNNKIAETLLLIDKEEKSLKNKDMNFEMKETINKTISELENRLAYYVEAEKDYIRNNFETLPEISVKPNTLGINGENTKDINDRYENYQNQFKNLLTDLKETKQKNIRDKYIESIANPEDAIKIIKTKIDTLNEELNTAQGINPEKLTIDDFNQKSKELQELKGKLLQIQQKEQQEKKRKEIETQNDLLNKKTKLNKEIAKAFDIYSAYNTNVEPGKEKPTLDINTNDYKKLKSLETQIQNLENTDSLDKLSEKIQEIIKKIEPDSTTGAPVQSQS